MSIAVEYERFILTANKLSERIVSGVPDRRKLFREAVALSGGRS
jgi:hypothetical protein